MKNFDGRVAAITGAGSGIGRALALKLADAGCHLSLSDVNEAGLAETVAMLASASVTVTSATVDVASRVQVESWARQTVADHGKVHMIFNNAGVALGGTVLGTTIEEYEWIVNINFWGVVYGTKAFLPHLIEAGEGHVINVSSIFGLFAQPTQSGYNATKFAVRGFTESLRQELDLADNGVSATCVHPGGIKTNIAASARQNESIVAMTGKSKEESTRDFEKLFRTTPAEAADIILKAVSKNKRRVLVGTDAKVIDLFQRALPTAYQPLVEAAFKSRAKKAE
ncbi:MAG: SDR family NAD(P)-dependent oxidoreductase [Oceanococcaceae bacterium]